jgi:hypothetical protein
MSTKITQSDPSWNPSIIGRGFLKFKFYDVWFEVSSNNQAILPKGSTLSEVHLAHTLKTPKIHLHSLRLLRKEMSFSMHGIMDCGSFVKEMQHDTLLNSFRDSNVESQTENNEKARSWGMLHGS